MKICFVNSNNFYFNSSYDMDHHMMNTWHNHGIMSLSAAVKKAGFQSELIDLRIENNIKKFLKSVNKKKPDVIGFSMMSVDYDPVLMCLKALKPNFPEIKTIVGGIHPTVMLEEVESIKEIDYIMIGEGEISLVTLLKNIEKKQNSDRIIQGIKPILDDLPFEDRSLFQAEELPIIEDLEKPFVTIITGRGCKYNCSFCQPAERKVFGKKVRRRSVSNVIKELKELKKKYNFKTVMIHDDCTTEDIIWLENFCKEYRKSKLPASIVCQSRSDIICRHKNIIELFKDIGLKTMLIGFESGSQRILNFLRKGVTVAQNIKAGEICHKLDIKILANIMMGIPTETKKEIMETVEMLKEIHPYIPFIAFYTPHPGSDLFEYCREKNISLIKNHSQYYRFPDEPKIKGVDYAFIKKAISIAVGYSDLFKLEAPPAEQGAYKSFKQKLKGKMIGIARIIAWKLKINKKTKKIIKKFIKKLLKNY